MKGQPGNAESEDDQGAGFRNLCARDRRNEGAGKQPVAGIHVGARRFAGFPVIYPAPADKRIGAAEAGMAAEAMIIEIVELERITAAFLVNQREFVTATCAGPGAADAGCEGDRTGIAGADRLGVTGCADADI